MPFFCSRIPHDTVILSPQATKVSQLLLVFENHNSEVYLCVFCRMCLSGDLSGIFLMVRLGLWVLGRKIPERRYHFCHIISQAHTIHDSSPAAWTVRLRAHLRGVSLESALPFISLSKLCSSEGCHCGQAPFHKERGVTRQALQGGRYTDIIWNSSGWEIWEVSYKHILITPTHSWIRI